MTTHTSWTSSIAQAVEILDDCSQLEMRSRDDSRTAQASCTSRIACSGFPARWGFVDVWQGDASIGLAHLLAAIFDRRCVARRPILETSLQLRGKVLEHRLQTLELMFFAIHAIRVVPQQALDLAELSP